jgi:radical SAM/Cys-rich protein
MIPDSFSETVAARSSGPLRRGPVDTLQVNLGLRCDLACHHCHVEAGPKRTETMDRRTADRVVSLLAANPGCTTLDLTGGAPELQPEFRRLVRAARELDRTVIDRCNLTVFGESGQEDTPEFLADHAVRVVASLPCYTAENADQQRGRGVFARSIEALQRLNALGYGVPGGRLELDLVYNPLGATLPPPQAELEAEYRGVLHDRYGIDFGHLIAITNMPIKRFARSLERDGQAAAYQALLVERFNPETVPALMCRSLISVRHDGAVFDCDFNQMLDLEAAVGASTIFDFDDFDAWVGGAISTAAHCFGCTAGAGSSCSGALR